MGWDKKPELLFDMARNLDELSAAIADAAPVKTGRLRKELRKWGNYKASRASNQYVKNKFIGWRLTVPLPYARLRDQGGRIPDRQAKPGKLMRWHNSGGRYPGTWYRARAKGYDVAGTQYVRQGFEVWANARGHEWENRIKWRGK